MEIYLAPRAARQVRKLPIPIRKLVVTRIKQISKNQTSPRAKKLINREGWRIRIGDYRILYTFNKKKNELTILSVAHRREAYKY